MARRPTPHADQADPADALYATEPDDFVSARDRLARQLREAGDADAAKQVTRLRKPTVAAYIVNRLVLAEPDTVGRLRDLNGALREAQTALDADRLRELTEQRRAVVGELARSALAEAGRADAPTGLRDEVVATLDAAVADPEVTGRLGRLLRAEHWSGFGVAAGELPADAPALRLVRGGRGSSPTSRAAQPKESAAQPKISAAQPKTSAALRKAEREAAAADAALEDARRSEATARDRVRELTDELARLQQRVADARRDHDRARDDVTDAQSRRRRAQTALDRARRG